MTSCTCPTPPGGGTHNCHADDMAVCKIVNGQCVSQCHRAPLVVDRAMQQNGPQDPLVLEWIVTSIGGRRDIGRLQDPIFVQGLLQGVYLDSQGNMIARFRLPATKASGTTMSAAG